MAEKIAIERDAIFAEEAFVVEIQGLLHQIMEERGFTRADLARAMNVSRPRITQIFSDECTNLTVRLLARAMHAMGEMPELRCKLKWEDISRKLEYKSIDVSVTTDGDQSMWTELEMIDSSEDWRPANDNLFASLSHIRQSRADFRMAA